jgi:FkbM family methyltransferase
MINLEPRREIRNEDIDGVSGWVWIKTDSGAWDCRKQWPDQKKVVQKYCKKFDCVVQAGGNQGMYPRLMANMFKTVYTFEPHWENFYTLVLNCNLPNIIKINGALGDKHCMVNLSGGADGNMGTWVTKENENEIVPQFKIDDLNLTSLDLIYFDIERYERTALDGALESINKFKPLIACENGNEIKDYMDSLNYTAIENSHSDTFFIPK